jgi:CRAL/TRIO domain
MRKKNPLLFEKRDVLSDQFQQIFKTLKICPMPRNSPENHKISVFRLVDHDPEKYVYLDICRSVITMMDVRFTTIDKNELIDGEIGIIDMTGFGLKHLWKSAASISIAKNYMKYVQEAAPFKIIKNHFINCSSLTTKFLAVVKPFMNKEVFDTITLHTSMETLYECIPRELLPDEFGGTAGCMDDFYDDWIKVIESKRLVKFKFLF